MNYVEVHERGLANKQDHAGQNDDAVTEKVADKANDEAEDVRGDDDNVHDDGDVNDEVEKLNGDYDDQPEVLQSADDDGDVTARELQPSHDDNDDDMSSAVETASSHQQPPTAAVADDDDDDDASDERDVTPAQNDTTAVITLTLFTV